jgi:hypothetical protein
MAANHHQSSTDSREEKAEAERDATKIMSPSFHQFVCCVTAFRWSPPYLIGIHFVSNGVKVVE